MKGEFDKAAQIGRRQHGRVTRRQLLEARIDAKRVDRWVADGRLRIVHRGVYAIGHTAPSLEPVDLTRACHEAWVHHRVTPQMIEACIARNPTKPGAAKLRHAFGADVTPSKLEDTFVKRVKEHDLPLPPRTNIDVGGDKVDCHWEQHGLTIELHSYGFHATRYGFENDITRRRRSNHVAFSYGDVRRPRTRHGRRVARTARTHTWRARGLCPRNLRPIGRLWTPWTVVS